MPDHSAGFGERFRQTCLSLAKSGKNVCQRDEILSIVLNHGEQRPDVLRPQVRLIELRNQGAGNVGFASAEKMLLEREQPKVGHHPTPLSSCEVERVEVRSLQIAAYPVSYTHLRAHETGRNLVCRLLL